MEFTKQPKILNCTKTNTEVSNQANLSNSSSVEQEIQNNNKLRISRVRDATYNREHANNYNRTSQF